MGLTWGDNEKDISKDGGIMKIIVRKGEGYANPNDSAVCTVKYTGTADDTKFTTHGEDEEVTLNIDEDFSLPEGLVKALCSMNKGEKATFKVRSEYAYGEKGDEKLGIAPNTNLVYNIDLISFKNEKATWEMDVKEKLAAMVKKKGKGNTYFSMRKYGKAIDFYKKAVAIFPESDLKKAEADDKKEILKTQVSCHSNTALCHLKSREFAECIKSCNKALRIDKRHVKSIYRRGQAFSYNGENAQALYDLKHALKLSPDDKSIAKLVAVVKRRVQKQKRKDKNLFKGMFDRMTLAQGKNAGTQRAKVILLHRVAQVHPQMIVLIRLMKKNRKRNQHQLRSRKRSQLRSRKRNQLRSRKKNQLRLKRSQLRLKRLPSINQIRLLLRSLPGRKNKLVRRERRKKLLKKKVRKPPLM